VARDNPAPAALAKHRKSFYHRGLLVFHNRHQVAQRLVLQLVFCKRRFGVLQTNHEVHSRRLGHEAAHAKKLASGVFREPVDLERTARHVELVAHSLAAVHARDALDDVRERLLLAFSWNPVPRVQVHHAVLALEGHFELRGQAGSHWLVFFSSSAFSATTAQQNKKKTLSPKTTSHTLELSPAPARFFFSCKQENFADG